MRETQQTSDAAAAERPELLNSEQCAARLGISYPTFLKRRKAGDFPDPMNQTGRPIWHRDTVEAYVRGDWRRDVA